MTSKNDRGREAAADLAAAIASRLAEATISDEQPRMSVTHHGDRVDVIVRSPAGRMCFEVKALSRAEPSRVTSMIEQATALPGDTTRVLVADEIPQVARDLLERAQWGYLDRRGHLRIGGPSSPMFIDVDVAPMVRAGAAPQRPIRGTSGISYSAALLMTPDDPPSIREVARRSNISFSTVADAARSIRAAALVRRDGRPVIPDLFWALSDAWRPERIPLLAHPMPGEGPTAEALGVYGDKTEPGWAVTGDLAAVSWDAPMAVSSGARPDFYVPDRLTAANAARTYGVAPDMSSAQCTVAVAPTLLACVPRHGPGARVAQFLEYYVTHPLFVALDLAADKARGVEILEDWRPGGFTRVW